MCHLCWAKVLTKAGEATGVHGDEKQWEVGLGQGLRSAECHARLRRLHTNAFYTPTKACLLHREVQHTLVNGVKDASAHRCKRVWLSQQPAWWNPLIMNALQHAHWQDDGGHVCLRDLSSWPICWYFCARRCLTNDELTFRWNREDTDDTDTLIQNSSRKRLLTYQNPFLLLCKLLHSTK